MCNINLLYQIKDHQVLLWTEGSDILKFSVDQRIGFPEHLKIFVKENKAEIINILQYNGIFSEEKAKALSIYRIPKNINNKLSEIQQGIYIQSSVDQSGCQYTVPVFIKFIAADAGILKKSVQHLLSRHAMLRMTLNNDFTYHILDADQISIKESEVSEGDLENLINSRSRTPFNLLGEKLIQAEVIKIKDSDQIIVNLTQHHILSDAFSIWLMIEELQEIYQQISKGLFNEKSILDKQNIVDYFDFTHYQNATLQADHYQKAIEKMASQLEGAEKLQLVGASARRLDNRAKTHDFTIDSTTLSQLRDISLQQGTSLYAILLAAVYHVMSVYSGGSVNFPMGLTVSNRPLDCEKSIGPFISTLPLIPSFDPAAKFIDNIKHINECVISINEYSHANLSLLAQKTSLSNQEITDLMHVMFTLHNFRQNSGADRQKAELLQINEMSEKFGISITAREEKQSLRFIISYASSLYSSAYIQQLFDSFVFLLKHLNTKTIQQSISSQSLMGEDERQRLASGSSFYQDLDCSGMIHQVFEEQVKNHPNKTAIHFEENEFTYQEVNEKANQLAQYIQKTCQPIQGSPIALLLNESVDMIISMIAVTKLGCPYVPLNTDLPEDRIHTILKDTQAKILITHLSLLKTCMVSEEVHCITIDEPDISKAISVSECNNLALNISQQDLAYIIYTSGTTGQPKGVMIENRSVVSLVGHQDFVNISTDDRFIQLSDVAFDAATFEIWGPLLNGASLIIVPDKLDLISNIKRFKSLIVQKKISILWLTKSLFDQLMTLDDTLFSSLQYLLIGGEALNKNLIQKLVLSKQRPKHIINGYGPTENTTFSCTLSIEESQLTQGDFVPIGKPLMNRTAYILSKEMTLLPEGAIGELFVGGEGVARGYINHGSLTAEKFVKNPFQTEQDKERNTNDRLYKTGDLARWLPDGNIECLGRNDTQVKIHGYRIEIGEIENVILRFSGIKQCAVIADIQGEKRLVCYYVTNAEIDENSLKEFLTNQLPSYMIPTAFIPLETLPLTRNGKLNTQGLPKVSFSSQEAFIAPRDDLDKQLCQIWKTVLLNDNHEIGITEDFFTLGGNSILAISLVNHINNQCNTDIKITDLFRCRTILQLSDMIKKTEKSFKYKNFLIHNSESENLYEPFALTNVQQAYHLGRFSSFGLGNVSTHIYMEHQFASLDVKKLEMTFNQLIQRHLALRTVFVDGQQRFLESVPYYPISLSKKSDKKNTNSIRNRLSHKIYDPENFPLFDVIVSPTDEGYILHLSFDALLMDAQSFKMLFDEWTVLYHDQNAPLNELRVNYRDYILSLEKVRQSEMYEADKRYWQNKLDQYDFTLNLPKKCDESQVQHPHFGRISTVIKQDIWSKILDKCRDSNISPTALLLNVFGKVLAYWSGQKRICINLTLFNRLPLHDQINQIAGDFTVLELFNYIDQNKITMIEHLKSTHDTLWEDIEHSLFDGVDVQRLIRNEYHIPNEKIIAPIVFTSILGNTSSYQKDGVFIDKSYLGETYSITQTSQVWLDNKAYETKEGLVAEWDFVEQLFDRQFIQTLHDTYISLIEAFSEANWQTDQLPSIAISQQDAITIESANNSKQSIPEDTLHDRVMKAEESLPFEEQIAVVDSGKALSVTYGQLRQDCDALSRYLRHLNSQAPLIGVLSEKGINQVLSTLSIMRSGHAYLPLHVDWPAARLVEVLEQGGCDTVLVSRSQFDCPDIQAHLKNRFRLVVIEEIMSELKENKALRIKLTEVKLPNVKPDDVAYVIFTSGSTGKPKGVTISHRGALNTIDAVNARFNIHVCDRVLALSELSFDLSVYDIFGLLAVGGTVVFPAQSSSKDPHYWLELIRENHITVWNTVPQLAGLLVDESEQSEVLIQSLRVILMSGDWIPISLPKRLKTACPIAKVISLGGATEGSIWSIWYEIATVDPDWKSIPYGVAMPNQKMFVLNQESEHCPIGVVGEIHIGGLGVALNYWGDEEKTAASYFDHPKLGRLYRTGDLGKWHQSGVIEFVGRKDTQIKMRGYRVELGEIEYALQSHPNIQQSIVLAVESDDHQSKTLVGYYVSDDVLDDEKITNHLSETLPDYMIPQALIHLKKMPLTANGKVNLSALPKAESRIQRHYVAPRNELEKSICQIWSDVLKKPINEVGITNDFFSLGGDSIISIQLTSKLRQKLGINVRIQHIFECKDIATLVDKILSQSSLNQSTIVSEQGRLSGEVPLLPIQTWFFTQDFKVVNHWNQAFLIKTPALDKKKLKSSIEKLVMHHDAFNLRFKNSKQFYDDNASAPTLFNLNVKSISGNENLLTELQSHFDLSEGPLYAFAHLTGFADGSERIFLACHHLLIDNVSWSILAEDLKKLYHDEKLEDKKSSYRQWVAVVNQYRENNRQEEKYWRSVLSHSEKNAVWDQFLDEDQKLNATSFKLDRKITEQLLHDCHQALNTQINDLLLTALAYTLSELTGSSTSLITVEGHGREEIDDSIDISHTMGWFGSIYPVKCEVLSDMNSTLKAMKENLRAIPYRGIGYGAIIGYQDVALPPVGFNYLGKIDGGDVADGFWGITGESVGEVSSPKNSLHNTLNVGGAIINGELCFDIYSQLNLETTNQLTESYQTNLKKVIEFCVNKKTVEYTPSDFIAVESEADLAKLPLVRQSSEDGWFEMTEIQKVYLLGRLGDYEIGNVSNHVYHEYCYKTLDVTRLENVIHYLIVEFPVLRTFYSFERLQQRFLDVKDCDRYRITINYFDQNPINDQDIEVVRDRLSHKVYDPEKFPLFTFEVSQFSNGCILHISTDLILLDAHSRQALFELINTLYRSNSFTVKAPSISFMDYQNYYQLIRHSEWYKKDKTYWQDKIAKMPLRAALPFKTQPELVSLPKFTEHTLFIEKAIWMKFKEKAREHNVTYSSVLLAMYGAVIAYFSGQKELLITMTLFNRYEIHPDVDQLWGDFTSTNLFHFKDFGQQVIKTLKRTHERMWDDINHSLYTGVEVQRDLSKLHQLDNQKAVSPIVFTGLVGNLFDELEESTFLAEDEEVSKRFWSGQTSQAWIDLQAVEVSGAFMSKWLYVEQLFEPDYIAELNALYCRLITHLAENDWELPVSLFTLPKKDQEIVNAANHFIQPIPEDTLHDRFIKTVESLTSTNQLAVIDAGKNQYVTYAELGKTCQVLSRYLTHLNIEGQLIGILSEKGVNQVLATLAIMQSGHAYLPLHVDWPAARLVDVLDQGGCTTVLLSEAQYACSEIREHLANRYQLIVIESIVDELEKNSGLQRTLSSVALPTVKADDVAYVIFTSGSTGKPKGVTISHRGALNTLDAVNQRFNIHSNDRVLALSELSFDLSVYDIFGLLSVGAAIVFPEQSKCKDPSHWVKLIQENNITIWNTVPQLAGLLVDESEQSEIALDSLRVVLMSGDWIPINLPEKIKAICPGAKVISLGGATEGSIWSIWHEITSVDPRWKSIPYGVAMPNQKMFVLNQEALHCPLGVVGEIHIGGVGVALNYWGDQEKTNASYFVHPELGRLYRTGDLGKWNQSGYIEFVGRKDTQVKMRGYRVELGEIEHVLQSLPDIQQCIVLALETEGHQAQTLVAYYVSDKPLNEKVLTSQLSERLPEYMIPTSIIHCDNMPLTANGKVDLKSLPKPQRHESHQRLLPRDKTETQICEIWADILGLPVEKIGIQDDFFSLGGDSILSIKLISRLKQKMGLNIHVKDIFNFQTVEKLYDHTKKMDNSSLQPILSEQGALLGDIPLLPIQQWFMTQQFKNKHHWNQAFLVKTPMLELSRLQNACDKLADYHDALKIRFSQNKQFYADSKSQQKIKVYHVREFQVDESSKAFEEKIQRLLTDWQSEFNLESGPIYTIGYLHGFLDGCSRLFFACHHWVMDTVSWTILVEDLQSLYEGLDLESKRTSYRQWSTAMLEYPDHHQDERQYWESVLADYDENLLKITGQENIESVQFTLDSATTQRLLREANRAYHTQINDLLLTALACALKEITHSYHHHIVLEGHGREMIDSALDISRTVGWFTTMYPVRLELSDDLSESIQRIKENLREIPGKGIGYGPLMGYENTKLPAVGFNYLGQIEGQSSDTTQWMITADAAGEMIHRDNAMPTIINTYAMVANNTLVMNIASKLDKDQTEKFANAFRASLESIIHLCAESPEVHYTKSDFAEIRNESDLSKLPLVTNANQEDWFEMTEIQKVYLLGRLGIYEIGNVANHIYNEYCYDGLDIHKLERVLNRIIQSYSVMRTIYSFEKLQQRFLTLDDTPSYKILVNDYRGSDNADKHLLETRNRLSHKVYNPEQYPLFTFEVSRFKNRDILHISIDLILLDAQSRQALFSIMNRLYRDEKAQITLPRVTFKDYQDYYQQLKHSSWYHNDEAYWHQKLQQMPLRPELPFKNAPETVEYPIFIDNTRYIDKATWSKFKAQARKYNVTYSSVLLALYGCVISYFSGKPEFLITMTLFNRYAMHDDVNELLGDFTSTNLFHFKDFGRHIIETLRRTHDEMWNDINHALYTGMDVQRELVKLRKLDGKKAVSPIVFTAIVGNLLDETESTRLLEDGEKVDQRYWCGQTSQAWIDLQAIETGDEFMSKWLYVEQLFEPEYMAELNSLYCRLITHLAENDWEVPVSLFSLPEKDRRIVESSNQFTQPLTDETLHDRFLKTVDGFSADDSIAVIDSDKHLCVSYKELKRDVENLSRYLCHININRQLIGVLSEKGVNQVFATLSIMQSGHAYLPLHVDWPAARLDEVLEQGGCDTVLLSKKQFECAEIQENLSARYQLIVIEDILAELTENKKLQKTLATLTLPEVKAEDVAYVIFTSGSTGKPKGVTISHQGALNTIDAVNARFNINNKDRVLALSELSFDLSVYDIFGLLSVGGTIVFVSQSKSKDPSHWIDLIQTHHITIWNAVPQLAGLLVDESEQNNQAIDSLKVILMSGDWIPTSIPDQLKKSCPYARMISLGGATEGSIWSIWYEIAEVDAKWKSIPYGVAMPNQKMFVLNHHHEHCPVGVEGEIHIGGLGVALNYWGDEAKTAASYFVHPELGRLYRTGDLGKWDPSGYIEFVGRKDTQVKIRGYRVELGEIEFALTSIEGIRQAIVIVNQEDHQKNQTLVAYYVADKAMDVDLLTQSLQKTLPDYMVPKIFIALEEMPLSANGKVDFKQLPEINAAASCEFIAPGNDQEGSLVNIWSDLLSIDQTKISIDSNFFDVGGDSITMIRLKSKIEKELSISDLSLTDLFKYSTIKSLSDFLSDKKREACDVKSSSEKQKLGVRKNPQSREIAVIGLSGSYSGTNDIDDFWRNIQQGEECLDVLTKEACLERGVPKNMVNHKNFIPIGGIVQDIEHFDHEFWRFSLNDAKLTDPQIRKFIEYSWEALEKSGYIKTRREHHVGVFAGMSLGQYHENRILNNPDLLSAGMSLGVQDLNEKDYLTTRVSYLLGLTGPSLNINTACSTSLVAIIEACKNLELGLCDMALAGGVSLPMPENHGYVYQEGLIFARDGHCRVFDKDATGTIGGAGIGVVVLKRLEDAIADNDNIVAVIKGYATNNDGDRKVGYTAPSISGQSQCIKQAQKKAGVFADEIEYVECHGTGTVMGDPIELAALHEAFTENSRGSYHCQIGAVKANIGHAGSAAGIASFTKVCKMLQHKVLPKQVNFEHPNPSCEIEKTGFEISSKTRSWTSKDNRTRKAGVSSFGFGGTNSHVILEEFVSTQEPTQKSHYENYYLPLSAKSENALARYFKALADCLERDKDLDLAKVEYTLRDRRETFQYRSVLIAKDLAECITKLRQASTIQKANESSKNTLYLLMDIEESTHEDCQQLYLAEKSYRDALRQCCDLIQSKLSFDIEKTLRFKDSEYSVLESDHPIMKRLSSFIKQYALVKLYEFYGVNPSLFLSESVGEWMTAVCLGRLTLQAALAKVINTVSAAPEKSKKPLSVHRVTGKGLASVYESLSQLWMEGIDIRWDRMRSNNDQFNRVVDIPTYQFEKKACWIELSKEKVVVSEEKQAVKMDTSKVIDLKTRIEEIFCEILGIKTIEDHHSFFDLGGDSLSVINCIEKLNQDLGLQLAPSTLYNHETVLKMLTLVKETLSPYQPIVNLNDAKDKPILFMIHPGLAGCEVYHPLAMKLKAHFHCYGVDSYNLRQENKIETLHELALYYLQHINDIMMKSGQTEYHLLGWSLGGLISLEIASILESQGKKSIHLYVLDSVIDDDTLSSLKADQIHVEKLKTEFGAYLNDKGFNSSYIQHAVKNIDLANNFEKQGVTAPLKVSKIVLFKAMQKDPHYVTENLDKITDYSIALPTNNIDLVVSQMNNVKMIRISNAHHNSLLDEGSRIEKYFDELLEECYAVE